VRRPSYWLRWTRGSGTSATSPAVSTSIPRTKTTTNAHFMFAPICLWHTLILQRLNFLRIANICLTSMKPPGSRRKWPNDYGHVAPSVRWISWLLRQPRNNKVGVPTSSFLPAKALNHSRFYPIRWCEIVYQTRQHCEHCRYFARLQQKLMPVIRLVCPVGRYVHCTYGRFFSLAKSVCEWQSASIFHVSCSGG